MCVYVRTCVCTYGEKDLKKKVMRKYLKKKNYKVNKRVGEDERMCSSEHSRKLSSKSITMERPEERVLFLYSLES